jgi:uncharacterized protein YaiL (DUF2058 family)
MHAAPAHLHPAGRRVPSAQSLAPSAKLPTQSHPAEKAVSNSLQEQLLKLGLVDEKRARQAQQVKRQEKRRGGGQVEAQRTHAQKAQAEKAERDRQLNKQRQEEAERKARMAQIKELIDANRLPKGDGDVAYNFIDGSKVRRLYVNPGVHRQLVDGSAAIVKLRGQYNIVPLAVAEKIRERDAACIVTTPGDVATDTPEADDPYAKYQVPDDLMW